MIFFVVADRIPLAVLVATTDSLAPTAPPTPDSKATPLDCPFSVLPVPVPPKNLGSSGIAVVDHYI